MWIFKITVTVSLEKEGGCLWRQVLPPPPPLSLSLSLSFSLALPCSFFLWLFQGNAPFDPARLFRWQSTNSLAAPDDEGMVWLLCYVYLSSLQSIKNTDYEAYLASTIRQHTSMDRSFSITLGFMHLGSHQMHDCHGLCLTLPVNHISGHCVPCVVERKSYFHVVAYSLFGVESVATTCTNGRGFSKCIPFPVLSVSFLCVCIFLLNHLLRPPPPSLSLFGCRVPERHASLRPPSIGGSIWLRGKTHLPLLSTQWPAELCHGCLSAASSLWRGERQTEVKFSHWLESANSDQWCLS